ncbi:MAG: hypothetical protein OEV00_07205 [Acidobacteriota bacterium]|nr:hypothetical protein [Acidobacteriota bacterium]MDH3785100.1 hypothetical protein [Acidobacteriota bacterium]
MRISILTLALLSLFGPGAAAGTPQRWAPVHCGSQPAVDGDWNSAYRKALLAIEGGDYHAAEIAMCQALQAARRFDARDWRFAETLDELGRIAFELKDFELAERMEGAAIAEMLLATGPQGEPLRELDETNHAVIREDCRSGIGAYTTRLGWIHERIRGRITTTELEEAPWRVFAVGFVPLDRALAERLDWLVAQYLLQENVAAADGLATLQQELRSR